MELWDEDCTVIIVSKCNQILEEETNFHDVAIIAVKIDAMNKNYMQTMQLSF